ncbi:hypothetical protein E3J74_05055 [Candidatus Bathyarchaeota archaeon]|nr:MAG: hypothetical protein E3J74_05055 [Candidatus Bathyarchaeota archaeon]
MLKRVSPLHIEKIPTNEELEQLLEDALTEPNNTEKGKKFEIFFENVMSKEKDFQFVDRHSRSRIGEVDYVYRHELTDPFWQRSPYICVECKNRKNPTNSKHMNQFIKLVKDTFLCCYCVFITASSYSKSAWDCIRDARIKENILVIPIEGKHLKELIRVGFKDFARKLCEKTVFKK